MTRIVIAHRSTFIRDVIRLQGVPRGVYVVGEAVRPTELIDLCRSECPDVAIIEADFEDGTEVESLLALVLATGARAVVVCDDPSPERLTRILALGASGYLRHDTTPDQVLEAVEAVAGGASVLGPTATATILEQWRRLREPALLPGVGVAPTLTPRELDVLVAMADGLPAKLVARRLGVAIKTVENHKIRIFDKLGVRSQAQAVALAIAHGLLAAQPATISAGE